MRLAPRKQLSNTAETQDDALRGSERWEIRELDSVSAVKSRPAEKEDQLFTPRCPHCSGKQTEHIPLLTLAQGSIAQESYL